MNCWEFRNCPEDRKKNCPAYPHHGTHCARVQGTLDDGEEQKSIIKKFDLCFKCEFYSSEYFDRKFKGIIFKNGFHATGE